ncbi:MAG: DUF3048 domain-containing protein [Chloroflexota bacterium]|jgi:hypothetical protein
MRDSRSRFLIFILAVSLLLAACREEEIPPPPTQGADAPSQISAAPTETVPPTSTRRPAATATVQTSRTPEIQATATPTDTIKSIFLQLKEDFGDDVNPLTGQQASDPANLDRRPLAIKISNAPAKWVRPQSGFNDADLVFEHITEAGITRFTIIVYGKTPPKVGPIRSARLIDLELPAMYDAAFAYSGSSEGVRQKLLNSDFRPRILFAYEPGYYRTGEDKPIEHTLYGDPETFWNVLEEKGLNQRPEFNTYMAFSSDPPEGGQAANEAIVDYDWTIINWHFDGMSGKYKRWTDGVEHLDANTDEQVSAANVVVILAGHTQDYNICEQYYNGVCAAYSVQPQIFGTGPAVIFRDGQRYDVTWQRIGRYDMLTFVDDSGQPLPLKPGNTWFQVIPVWYENPVSSNP